MKTKRFHGSASVKTDAKERFNAKYIVNPTTDCWEWTAAISKDGYGVFSMNGKYIRAHRASYQLFKEPIMGGLLVCHTCDNKKCVNPSHLYLGNYIDNMRDAQERGLVPTAKCPSLHSYFRFGCRCSGCQNIATLHYKKEWQKNKAKRLAKAAAAERPAVLATAYSVGQIVPAPVRRRR